MRDAGIVRTIFASLGPVGSRPRSLMRLFHPRLRHASWRARKRGCARTATFAGASLVSLLALAACGEVHFVPSPYTPVNVEVLYAAQEDVSLIRWRLGSTEPLPDTAFELLRDGAYAAIDFSRSVFPGGVNRCSDGRGSCAQLVVRGRYALDPALPPVRAVHTRFGVLPGGVAQAKTIAETLRVQSHFSPRNDAVFVSMDDRVATDGPYDFPRAYERTIWPTTGLCLSDVIPDGTVFTPVDANAFAPPTPLTETGLYCVGARPLPADGGARVLAQARVATSPEIVNGRQTFMPPVEKAPVMYQLILDLEIPVPDRCASALAAIDARVRTAFERAKVRVVQMPTINLATGDASGCAQTSTRSFDSTAAAQAVKELVVRASEVHHRFHVLYFNNLDAPLPDTLVHSFEGLFGALTTPDERDLQTIAWMFNPGGAQISGLPWTTTSSWQTADDPALEDMLIDYADKNLPYTTQIFDPSVPVRLMTAGEAQQYPGALVKICLSSPPVQPSYHGARSIPSVSSWPVDPAEPPAYLVNLAPQIGVPAPVFVQDSVTVVYQICRRYCVDHPYVSADGDGVLSWTGSTACAREEE